MTELYSNIDSIKVMADRRQESHLALVEALSRQSRYSSSTPHFWREFETFRVICVPELESLEQVYYIDDYINFLKNVLDSVDITLFKIPRLVNNIDGYMDMLLREHYKPTTPDQREGHGRRER